MKLQKLKVENYKNLKEFEINFSNSNVTVLIGTNGSGKSNIIEVLSKVFRDQYFDQSSEVPNPSSQIEYNCNYIIDTNEEEAYHKFVGKSYDNKDNLLVAGSEFSANEYLPSKVICMYSGEEKRLWDNSFKELYLKYIACVKKMDVVSQKMIFVNHYHWSIALLLLAIYAPVTYQKLGLGNIRSVHIDFSDKDISKYSNNIVVSLVKNLKFKTNGRSDFAFSNLKDGFEKQYPNKEDVFNLLVLATLPKQDKLIENIEIVFDNNVRYSHLSEGEKKLVLLHAIYELLADSETLVLLDEPDTHVYEGRKYEIAEIVSEYTEQGVCTVMTSHSPTMTRLFDEEQIVVLKAENGKVEKIPTDKLKAIELLTNKQWGYIDANIFLQSNKPLIILEGKTDVCFVKRALELLSLDNENYKKLDVDFLSCNGSGSAQSFIAQIKEIFGKKKKIVIVFDRDDAGKDGAAGVLGIKKTNEKIAKFQDYVQGSVTVSFLPYSEEVKSGEFLIEDYFTNDAIKKLYDNRANLTTYHPVKAFPNLSTLIKKDLSENYANFSKEDFSNFSVLLDKLIELISEVH